MRTAVAFVTEATVVFIVRFFIARSFGGADDAHTGLTTPFLSDLLYAEPASIRSHPKGLFDVLFAEGRIIRIAGDEFFGGLV